MKIDEELEKIEKILKGKEEITLKDALFVCGRIIRELEGLTKQSQEGIGYIKVLLEKINEHGEEK